VAVAIERAVHGDAARQDIRSIVSYLEEVLGQRLTALAAGVSDAKAVRQWAKGERVPRPDTERCLRHTYQIAQLLMRSESSGTVRAWFMGMNPELEDMAPVLVIAEDPVRVIRAARAFLAHG
jgi:hypothetical protein